MVEGKTFTEDDIANVNGLDDAADPWLLRNYELIQKLGHGAFGIVWRALEKKPRKPVAVKKIHDCFSTKEVSQRAIREASYLMQLSDHDNIIKLIGIHLVEPTMCANLYLVFELMDTDLFLAIKARILKPKHCNFITYQVLRALQYIHSAGLVHGDIKPSNILLNRDCHAKLADFGCMEGCKKSPEEVVSLEDVAPNMLRGYAGSRWYRAPEHLLGSSNVATSSDIWSLACVISEMALGKPIFPGKSSAQQIHSIIRVIGLPNEEELIATGSPIAKEVVELTLEFTDPEAFSKIFQETEPEIVDILRMCFQIVPDRRPTASDLLRHPLIFSFFQPDLDGLNPKVETPRLETFEDCRREVVKLTRKLRSKTRSN